MKNQSTIIKKLILLIVAILSLVILGMAQKKPAAKGFNIDINGVDSICIPCTGWAHVEIVSGGTPPFEFEWSDGSTQQYRYDLCAGFYEVSVTDSNNYTEVADYQVVDTCPGFCDFDVTILAKQNISCYGSGDGSITIKGENGQPPYNVGGSNSFDSITTISQLQPGFYEYMITDEYQCKDTVSFQISQPDSLRVSTTEIIHTTELDSCNGFAGIIAEGGTPPYSYFWEDSFHTSQRDNLCEGTYTVLVTDSNDCSDSITVRIKNPDLFSLWGAVSLQTNRLQQGQAVLFLNASGKLRAVKTAPVADGLYCFDSLYTGQYLVLAVPYFDVSQHYFPHYFPTYYPGAITWEEAEQIHLDTAAKADIYLSYHDSIHYGKAVASGTIKYTEDAEFEEGIYNKPWFNDTSKVFFKQNQINPARNIPVFLLNNNQQPIFFRLSDADGRFVFHDLPMGNYTLYAEKAGYEAQKINFTLDSVNDTINDIHLQICKDAILDNVEEKRKPPSKAMHIFPNPAEHRIYLRFPSEKHCYSLIIVNTLGEEVYKTGKITANDDYTMLNISFLQNGTYFLLMRDENGSQYSAVFIKQ